MNVEIYSGVTIACFVLMGLGLYQKKYRFSSLSGILLAVSGALLGLIDLAGASPIQAALSGMLMVGIGAILALRFSDMDKKAQAEPE